MPMLLNLCVCVFQIYFKYERLRGRHVKPQGEGELSEGVNTVGVAGNAATSRCCGWGGGRFSTEGGETVGGQPNGPKLLKSHQLNTHYQPCETKVDDEATAVHHCTKRRLGGWASSV